MEQTTLLISFKVDAPVAKKLDDHVDLTKIKLRKRGIKFAKRDIIRYMLVEYGVPNFDIEGFITFLEKTKDEEKKQANKIK